MSDIIERLLTTRDCMVCDGDGTKSNGKICGGCDGAGKVLSYGSVGKEAADEIERLRALSQQPLSVQEGWRPIAEADNGIAHIIDAAGLHIGNSLPIWARDIDGRVFECLWADDGKRAYWWDIEGESPVDPVEFMPHPLAALKTTGGSPE